MLRLFYDGFPSKLSINQKVFLHLIVITLNIIHCFIVLHFESDSEGHRGFIGICSIEGGVVY